VTTTPDIPTLLRSRTTLLWVSTREELRVERAIAEAAASVRFDTVLWDCSSGLTQPTGASYLAGEGAADPEAALSACRSDAKRAVWIFRDLDKWLAAPTTSRRLKSLARDLQAAPGGAERCIVVLSTSSDIPPELRGCAHRIEWPIPDRDEVARILDATLEASAAGLRARLESGNLPDGPKQVAERKLSAIEAIKTNGQREAAIDAAVGLTAEEIAGCYARSLVACGSIDPEAIRKDKASVVSSIPGLEWIDPNPAGLAAVGGLESLKRWLVDLRPTFGEKAREYGLPAPKGVLLTGQPGCGKSHTAKAVATAWGMPLVRIDLGATKSKYVGESEGNIRQALQVAESVAPCVLWLDEVEKALAGTGGEQGDGGVATDQLGAILTWLQERAGKVFLVATANDVGGLPPELLRKGRFDDIFFVDLPSPAERGAIAAATIRAHGRDPDGFDLDTIAAGTCEFSGAEVAESFVAALRRAFADGAREPTTEDVVKAANDIVPAARTSAESVQARRDWAKGRARPASDTTTSSNTVASLGRAVEV
jgi:ATP-dependent 26S proteasome regulatory subunit